VGSRVGGAVVVTASVFTFATASASACEDPSPQRAKAGAGDRVEFALPGTSEGARYALTIGGERVHEGEDRDSEPGVKDSFVVPDLGAESRTIEVAIEVAEGEERCTGVLELDYRGRRAAPAAPAPPPRQPPRQAPAPAAVAPAPVFVSVPAAAPAPWPSAPSPSARKRSRVAGVTVASPALVRIARVQPRRAPARKRRRPRKHRPQKVTPLPSGGPAKPRPTPPDVSREKADLSGGGFPGLGYSVAWQLLVGAALSGFLLMALVGVRTRLRSGALKP